MRSNSAGQPLEWADGSVVQYLKWAPGEPNDVSGTQLCVEMYVTLWPGLWNDHLCGEYKYTRGFVCKAFKGE